jgi:hypothetical protein
MQMFLSVIVPPHVFITIHNVLYMAVLNVKFVSKHYPETMHLLASVDTILRNVYVTRKEQVVMCIN